MKVLTIHHLKVRKDDFCFGIEGEIALPSVVCDNPRCGCDRAFGGLNSHRQSTALKVRDLDMTYADLMAAYVAYLESAGWANAIRRNAGDGEVYRIAADTIDAALTVAAEHPDGTVLRPRYDRSADDWQFRAA